MNLNFLSYHIFFFVIFCLCFSFLLARYYIILPCVCVCVRHYGRNSSCNNNHQIYPSRNQKNIFKMQTNTLRHRVHENEYKTKTLRVWMSTFQVHLKTFLFVVSHSEFTHLHSVSVLKYSRISTQGILCVCTQRYKENIYWLLYFYYTTHMQSYTYTDIECTSIWRKGLINMNRIWIGLPERKRKRTLFFIFWVWSIMFLPPFSLSCFPAYIFPRLSPHF